MNKTFCDSCLNEIQDDHFQVEMYGTNGTSRTKYYSICKYCHAKIKEFINSITPTPAKISLIERLKGNRS